MLMLFHVAAGKDADVTPDLPGMDSNSLLEGLGPSRGPSRGLSAGTMDEILTPQLVQSYLAFQLHKAALDMAAQSR